jgi:hypothetical protein
MRKKTQVTLIGSGIVALSVLVATGLWIKGLQSNASALTWGGPLLCVSERDYCMSQIDSLLQGWKSQNVGRNMPDSPEEDESLLAIDLDHGVMWLDPAEVPWQRKGVALPGSLAWTLYCRDGNQTVTLPRFVCLRHARSRARAVALVGRARNGMYLACILNGPRQGMIEWEGGAFDPNSLYGGRPGQDRPSMMITDEARLRQIAQHRPDTAVLPDTAPLDGLDSETRKRMAWQALQKPLYRAMEKQATDRGYDVARVVAYPGPDWTAGMAGVALQNGSTVGFWQRLFGGRRNNPPFLLFTVEADHNGLWQCRSTDSGRPGPPGGPMFNFKVQTPDAGSDDIHKPLEPSLGEPRWSVFLDGGTQVELIGIYRDMGKTWWAPDGSALDYWPGFSRQQGGTGMIMHDLMTSRRRTHSLARMTPDPGQDRDERCFAVLRAPSTLGFANRGGSSSSGSTAVHFGGSPFIDRFGQSQFRGQYIVLTFDAQAHSTVSHGLGIHVLQNPQGTPGILQRSNSRTPGSGGVAVGGGRVAGGSIAGGSEPGPLRTGGIRRSIPLDMSRTRTLGTADAQLQWIHLENLSLQANQKTDFRMTVSEAPVNAPTTSRVQVMR